MNQDRIEGRRGMKNFLHSCFVRGEQREERENGILTFQGHFRNFNYLGKNSENWCYIRKLFGIEMFNQVLK